MDTSAYFAVRDRQPVHTLCNKPERMPQRAVHLRDSPVGVAGESGRRPIAAFWIRKVTGMVGKSFMQSTALAVLAAVGAMSVPAQAQDADQQERQEARAAMRESRQQQRVERQTAAPEQRAERQAQRAERQSAAPSQELQAAGNGRGWSGDDNRGEARRQQQARQQQGGGSFDNDRQARILARQQERAAAAQQQGSVRAGGWRSQRAPDGQHYGRNWDNGGTVTRPAPADNAATPSIPQRGSDQQWRGRGEARDGADWANRRNRT